MHIPGVNIIETCVYSPHLYSSTEKSMIKWSIGLITCTHDWQRINGITSI